jgi:hypothetical protein
MHGHLQGTQMMKLIVHSLYQYVARYYFHQTEKYIAKLNKISFEHKRTHIQNYHVSVLVQFKQTIPTGTHVPNESRAKEVRHLFQKYHIELISQEK